MTMNFTLDSDPHEVREYLRAPLILIGETLEAAIPAAQELIRKEGLEFSPFLFSNYVRCHLKKSLKSGGYDPQDSTEPVSVELNALSNDGIDFRYGELHLKVLKGPKLPKAASAKREEFYCQQSSFEFKREDYKDAPLRNLVFLWEYDRDTNSLTMLLFAPKNAAAEDYWWLPVPTPPEWISPTQVLETEDQDLDLSHTPEKIASGQDEK